MNQLFVCLSLFPVPILFFCTYTYTSEFVSTDIIELEFSTEGDFLCNIELLVTSLTPSSCDSQKMSLDIAKCIYCKLKSTHMYMWHLTDFWSNSGEVHTNKRRELRILKKSSFGFFQGVEYKVCRGGLDLPLTLLNIQFWIFFFQSQISIFLMIILKGRGDNKKRKVKKM